MSNKLTRIKVKDLRIMFNYHQTSPDGMSGRISLADYYHVQVPEKLLQPIKDYLTAGLKEKHPEVEEVVFDE